ncbi:phosphotransferase family protein [Inquilinus limosus]|uniref:phosphotransferase family protein n=1 Tax=Inquilinus limosus TaxID=171674 RepID=UPI00068A37F0|nr:phosphotransferase [Inquilinus limosus]
MAKPVITRGEAETLLATLMPGAAWLEPLAEGDDSRAFAFRRDGEAFVLRLNRDGAGFDKDAFIQRRFAGPALPIPEILRVERRADGLALCISRRAPGTTLQDLDDAELDAAVAPTAAVLEAIAAADLVGTAGYGRFDAVGRGARASWQAFLREPLDWTDLPANDAVGRIRDHLAALAGRCPEERRLVHGDFGSNNVLAEGGRITGVIDWSEALFGDPLYDVANILFWRPWLACMERQAAFLEAHCRWSPEVRDRLLCYQLRIGIDEIRQGASAGAAEDLAWAMRRCAAILDETGAPSRPRG